MFEETRIRLSIALLLLLFILPTATAATATDHESGYIETVLDNGLRVALVERHEVPMVCYTAVVGAGSALEPEDFSGASHFLEHLLFNGTTTMTQQELYDAVDRIGGYNNAHTSEDYTAFTMLVPASAAKAGLEIQAAMLLDSALPADKFEKERKIVLEELAKDLARPGEESDRLLRHALSPSTAWGRPVIGTADSLGGITLDRIRTYYERQYVPNNMAIVVIGDFETETMLAMLREAYANRPHGDSVEKVTSPFLGTTPGTITRVALPDASTTLAISLPAPGPCEPSGAAVQTLAELLGSDAGPLRRALSFDDVSKLSVSYVPRRAGSSFRVDANLTASVDPDTAVKEILAAIEAIAAAGSSSDGIDPVEVLRVARSSRSGALLIGQRIHYFGMLRSDTIAACSGELAPVLAPDLASGTDPREVADAARSILGHASATARVAIVSPAVESSPAVALPPVDITAARSGTMSAADGDRIDRTLPNGLRVIVKRESPGEVTGIHVLVRDRAAREPNGRDGIADVLHRMLPRGTALSSRAQLGARIERLGADFKTADSDFIPYDDYYTSPTHSFIRLEVPSENWLPALDLLAEMIRLPRLDPAELTSLLDDRILRAKKVDTSPSERARTSYRAAMLGDSHPEIRPLGGTEESLAAITIEELRAFADEYFTPGGLVITAVSPAEPEDVFGAITERFETDTPVVKLPTIPAWPLTRPSGQPVVVEIGSEQAQVNMGRIAELAPEDRAGVMLLAAVLSDRMGRTIREEQGLAYRLGASASLATDRGWFSVNVGTRPDNVDTVIEAIREQMNRLREEMSDETEINRVRAVERSRALMRQMTAINRARSLGLRAFEGLPHEDDPETLDAMDRVDRETLERLARTWLNPNGFQVVVVR